MIGAVNRLDAIIDRIRKLVSLAKGGSTEAEAEQAMRRAHALVARHNLDLGTVLKEADRRCEDDRRIEAVESTIHIWEQPIWTATAELYFCVYYYCRLYEPRGSKSRAKRVVHHLVGKNHNIVVARLMIDYFLKTVRRLAKEHGVQVPSGERHSFVHSFKVSCARRLADRIWERLSESQQRRVPEDSGSKLPVLRSLYTTEDELNEEFLAEEGIELQGARSQARITHVLGEIVGKDAADTIGLDTQIGTSDTSLAQSDESAQLRLHFK